MTAVRLRGELRIPHRLMHVRYLRSRGWSVRLGRHLSLSRGRLRGDAAGAVVARLVDGHIVDRDVVHIGVMDHRGVHIGHCGVVVVCASLPAPAVKADAAVAEPVIHTAVETDVRTPVAGVKRIHAADETPVAGRPENADGRRGNPGARNPVVTSRRERPVTRRPNESDLRTGRLLIIGQRRRRLGGLLLDFRRRCARLVFGGGSLRRRRRIRGRRRRRR